MEDNKNSKKAIDKFFYEPSSIDIAQFSLNFDHLQWQLLCKQAQDLTTTVEFLLGSIVERYLIQTGYLDPKAPSTNPFPIAVTIKDLRNEPDEYNLYGNMLMEDSKKNSKEEPEKKAKGLRDIFDDGLDL